MKHSHDTRSRDADGKTDRPSRSGLRLRAGLILAVAALAACASPDVPAPIVHRNPVPQAEPLPPPPTTITVPSAASPAADVAAEGVEAAPIRSGRVESRPLGGTVALPQAPLAPQSTPAEGLRQAPNGLKRPYSEAEVAKLSPAPGKRAAPAPSAVPGKVPSLAPQAAASGGVHFAWPVKGKLIQRFSDAASMGIAIAAPIGTPVHAAEAGKVIFSGRGPRSYGNLVIVKHPNELLSVYAHNSKLLVKEGQSVKRGQKIAEVGSTGAESARLGFEVRRQGKPIDPMSFLSQ